MALIKCKECNGLISNTAKTCPHCGKSRDHIPSWLTWFMGINIVGVLVLSIDTKPIEPQKPAESQLEVKVQDDNAIPANTLLQQVSPIYSLLGKYNVEVISDFDAILNEAGNFSIEDSSYRIYFESNNNLISYIQVYIKDSAPCKKALPKNPFSYLDALGFNVKTLRPRSTTSYISSYFDDAHGVIISGMCQFEGGMVSYGIRRS